MDNPILKIINDTVEEGTSCFKSSIRDIYEQTTKGRPNFIGSCVLLSINNKKYLLTAAHILNEFKNIPIYVHGTNNELVEIYGLYDNNKNFIAERLKNHIDFAWVQLSEGLIELCGANDFISEERIVEDSIIPEGRFYLALGYPCSKNKPDVGHKRINPEFFRYLDLVKNDESLCKKLSILGKDHRFLKYDFEKYKNENGGRENAIDPTGLSGGALVDMGLIADRAKPGIKPAGKLAGLLIEKHNSHNAIVAVKIGTIINLIKENE